MAFREIERVVRVDKNAAEQIVVTRLVTERGDTFADIRLFVATGELENVGTADESFAYIPTKNGVPIPKEHIDVIVGALRTIEAGGNGESHGGE